MKRRILVLLAAAFVITVRPARAETGGLQNVGSFALGGVGVAGTMSAGERALREILKQPDAVARLEAVLSNVRPLQNFMHCSAYGFAITPVMSVRWKGSARPTRRWKRRADAY